MAPVPVQAAGATKPPVDEEVLELEIVRIVRGVQDLEAVSLKQLRAELERNLMLEAGALEEHKSHIGTLAAKVVQQVRNELLPDRGNHTPRRNSRRHSKRQQEIDVSDDVSARKQKRRRSKSEAEPPIASCLEVVVGNKSVETRFSGQASVDVTPQEREQLADLLELHDSGCKVCWPRQLSIRQVRHILQE
eukprot:CAMPEP_0172672278 /NCGR_PEP_ID=MMETSP1074-20121228/11446_1 /TAXON_ID=2916 /ORGANISM="Ceratium fusus, Strain PA161109" /LENGTH=190 /DNA_ID=CAMNT_0013489443 /DNA_START=22 /DNA_END=594 /DNA_ORIENTATION=+